MGLATVHKECLVIEGEEEPITSFSFMSPARLQASLRYTASKGEVTAGRSALEGALPRESRAWRGLCAALQLPVREQQALGHREGQCEKWE